MVGTLEWTRIRNGNLVIPLKTSDKPQNITQVPTLYIVTWYIFLAVALNCILSAFKFESIITGIFPWAISLEKNFLLTDKVIFDSEKNSKQP